MNATLSAARDTLIRAAESDEETARLLLLAAPAYEGDRRYRACAIRARAAARLLRENAAMLRAMAGPDRLCMKGHGQGEREAA